MKKRYIDFVPTKSSGAVGETRTPVRPGQTTQAGILMPNGNQRKVRSMHSNVTGKAVNTGNRKTSISGRTLVMSGASSARLETPRMRASTKSSQKPLIGASNDRRTPIMRETSLARSEKPRARTSAKSSKKSLISALRLRKGPSNDAAKSKKVESRGGVVPNQIVPSGKNTTARMVSREQPLGVSRGLERGVQMDTRVPVRSNKVARSGVSGGSKGTIRMEMRSTTTSGLKVTSGSKAPVLGVIEETNVKFVRTDVPKRPLGEASHFAERRTGVSAIKAKKVGMGGVTKGKVLATSSTGTHMANGSGRAKARSNATAGASRANSVNGATRAKTATGMRAATSGSASQNQMTTAKKEKVSTYQMPKSPFINQGKVQKRPLSSKNVYPKKTPVSRKEPSGPVTIISKSEKSSRAGLVMTIVLTIVLGAAAGTIAFLLLPK